MALREYGGNQFLRSCFTVGSGDANDPGTQLTAVVIGKLLQCLQTVVYKYISLVSFDRIFGFVDDGISATGFQCFSGKCISIERLAFQSDKQ